MLSDIIGSSTVLLAVPICTNDSYLHICKYVLYNFCMQIYIYLYLHKYVTVFLEQFYDIENSNKQKWSEGWSES